MTITTRMLARNWFPLTLAGLIAWGGVAPGAGQWLGTRLAVAQFQGEDPDSNQVPVVPQTAAFKEATDAFREHLKIMRETLVTFNTTPVSPADKELEVKWFALQREGRPLFRNMLDAAVAEFQASPSATGPLADMLWGILDRSTKADHYEGMLPVALALQAAGYVNKELPALVTRTAYALNNFDVVRQQANRLMELDRENPLLPQLTAGLDPLEQNWAEELAAREQDAQGPPLPRVKIHTTKGEIEIELFENQAPETVANFISLIESNFYEGLVFHRVIEQFMAQTGCPIGDGTGGPGYTIYDESNKPGARKFFRGTVGLALSGQPNSGGSQFFITFLPVPDLNGKYTAFGRVTAGMDVLASLVRVNPDSKDEAKKKPVETLDEIRSIEVLNKRDHEYKPHIVK